VETAGLNEEFDHDTVRAFKFNNRSTLLDHVLLSYYLGGPTGPHSPEPTPTSPLTLRPFISPSVSSSHSSPIVATTSPPYSLSALCTTRFRLALSRRCSMVSSNLQHLIGNWWMSMPSVRKSIGVPFLTMKKRSAAPGVPSLDSSKKVRATPNSRPSVRNSPPK
jgi:hypothetical protein